MHNVLTNEQVAALARVPIGGKPNRLGFAFALAGVRQADVASATGLTESYISATANGRYQTITLDNARKFAEFFGAPIEVLFPERESEVA
jgi:transcriptional regulator with XRE-family HTH domain